MEYEMALLSLVQRGSIRIRADRRVASRETVCIASGKESAVRSRERTSK